MPGRSLNDLVAAGLLQAKPPDGRRVSRWLARSRKDLDLAANLLADVDRDRAMAVAYEAGYRACAGILDLAGYRVTSQPGHHRAAIDGATRFVRYARATSAISAAICSTVRSAVLRASFEASDGL